MIMKKKYSCPDYKRRLIYSIELEIIYKKVQTTQLSRCIYRSMVRHSYHRHRCSYCRPKAARLCQYDNNNHHHH
jgi:hypothetical protein